MRQLLLQITVWEVKGARNGNSKINFFINYEKTALQIFFYFARMFFGS